MKVNLSQEETEKALADSDLISFVYVFDSQQEKSIQFNDQIMTPLLEELKGYNNWFAFDCSAEGIRESKRF